jgi:transposase-like protein
MVLSRRMSHGRTRRKFSPEQKLCIINEYSKAPLGMKSRVLHQYGIKRHHIDAWKQQMGKPKKFPPGEKYPGRRAVKSLLDAITPEAVAAIIPGVKAPKKKKKKLNLVTIDLDTFKTLVSMGLPPLAALDGSKVN